MVRVCRVLLPAEQNQPEALAEFCAGTTLGAAAFFRQPENNGSRKANTSMGRKGWTINLFVLIFPTSAKPEHRQGIPAAPFMTYDSDRLPAGRSNKNLLPAPGIIFHPDRSAVCLNNSA